MVASILTKQLEGLNLEVVESTQDVLAALITQPSLIERIKESEKLDGELEKIRKQKDFEIQTDESLTMKCRLCVSNDDKLKDELLKEAHSSKFSIHPGSTNV